MSFAEVLATITKVIQQNRITKYQGFIKSVVDRQHAVTSGLEQKAKAIGETQCDGSTRFDRD